MNDPMDFRSVFDQAQDAMRRQTAEEIRALLNEALSRYLDRKKPGRKPGRPAGSVNKRKAGAGVRVAAGETGENPPASRRRGRPPRATSPEGPPAGLVRAGAIPGLPDGVLPQAKARRRKATKRKA